MSVSSIRYPENVRVQQCALSYDVFLFSLLACLHTYDVTFYIGWQMDPWQRNQSSVEREVGQQQSILDRGRKMVGGWVTSGQVLAHIAVISLLSATHTDFQPVSHFLSCLNYKNPLFHLLTRCVSSLQSEWEMSSMLSSIFHFSQCSAACHAIFMP